MLRSMGAAEQLLRPVRSVLAAAAGRGTGRSPGSMGMRRVVPVFVPLTLRVSRSIDLVMWMTRCSRLTSSYEPLRARLLRAPRSRIEGDRAALCSLCGSSCSACSARVRVGRTGSASSDSYCSLL
jgi:hypothetical protein